MTWRPASFRTGAMRERITVEEPTETVDAYGEPVVTWSTVFSSEPASYFYAGGTETMRGRQLESSVQAVFVVRYRTGYTTQQRLTFGGVSYGITHINPVEGGKRYLELYCRLAGTVAV